MLQIDPHHKAMWKIGHPNLRSQNVLRFPDHRWQHILSNCYRTSLWIGWWDIMKIHDMSWHIMINDMVLSWRIVKCHQISPYITNCHHVKLIFGDFWAHLCWCTLEPKLVILRQFQTVQTVWTPTEFSPTNEENVYWDMMTFGDIWRLLMTIGYFWAHLSPRFTKSRQLHM